MTSPFDTRSIPLSGPALDIVPIVPDDIADLPVMAVALYCEQAGTITLDTVTGTARTVAVGPLSILPVGVRKVHASGTTASGLHALVLQ